MYHPTPIREGDVEDAGEYLELYNSGPDTVDLSGYAFDRGISFTFPEGTFLQANSYLVVTKTPSPLTATIPAESLFSGFTGTLSNAGESIRLVSPMDRTITAVTYGTLGDWPAAADGTGHSLVFQDFSKNPDSARNWKASRSLGGSPGGPDFPNDNTNELTRSLIKKGTIGQYFKGTEEPSNGTIARTRPSFETDNEWLVGPSGFGYSSAASELASVSTLLSDMRGNYLSLYVRIPFDLAPEEVEQIETLSLTMHYDDSYVIYLNGIRVAANGVNGTPPAFDQNANAGNDYPPETINLTAHKNLLSSGSNILAIQGHNIGINNSSDFVIGPELGITLAPQQSIDELIQEIQINELQTNHPSAPDFIEFFNPTESPIDLGSLWLSDKSETLNTYQIPTGTIVGANDVLSIPLSAELTGFAMSSFGDQIFLSTADLTAVIAAYAFGPQPPNKSFGRYPDGANNWVVGESPSPGTSNNQPSSPSVAISELMYHDPMSERSEYIEIKNVSSEPLDLSGWELNGVQFVFANETILQPGVSVLIADDQQSVQSAYALEASTIIGEYAGSLSNQGERISLLDAFDIVVDTVRYDDSFPWSITPDGLGASLERNCFERASSQASDWSASPLNRPSPARQNNIESCDEPSESSVRISEFLYHPATDTDDDRATEFIEIVNTGSTAVLIDDWVVVGDIFYLFPPGTTIKPTETLILAWDPISLVAAHNLDSTVVFGPYLGELSNGGGEILLVQQNGRLADSVRYNDDFPWASITDGGQADQDISLKRLCLAEPGNDPINWIADSEITPGSVSSHDSQPCTTPTSVLSTGTQPQFVTTLDAPVIFAEFASKSPQEAWIEYWIDDPELTSELITRVELNDQGSNGDESENDQIWSTTLPALPINSIVRYTIHFTADGESKRSPSPNQDAFESHAYFVDPQTDTNLPNNYHLFISSQNWQALYSATQAGRVSQNRANPRWNNEVPAIFIADGVVHDVSVRHQGSRWNRRNGSTINFDCESHQNGSAQVRSWRIEFPSHRNHNGMDVIILQKQSGWPQHISFKMFELAGVPAPRTSWANLRINGCDYNSDAFQIERPGRDLVARWFGEVGDLFKSQGYTGDEGPWSWGDARLIRGSRNGSSEQERYEHTYNRKTLGWKNNPFDGIEDAPEAMIEGLHQARGQGPLALRTWLSENFDVERTLRYICTINYVGTFDDMFQNHYLYRKADDGKWCMFPWDMDNTLGGAFGGTNANPFRGVQESRHGNVGNRSGWWNRIKDSFFIAFEAEFLEMFHHLNNSVHAPEALEPMIQESAAIRGLSQGTVNSLVSHLTRRHNYLNSFIEPRLRPARLSLTKSNQGFSLAWPSERLGIELQHASDPAGPWTSFPSSQDSPLEFTPTEPTGYFRLAPRP